ncbi:MAG TPA: pectin acetylesterase-family hydrolase [Pseudomonadales bacterium]
MGALRHLTAVAAALFMLSSTPALAELGDYSALRTVLNLLFPPAPDRPVTPGERVGEYPLLANPAGYDDGFSPGVYRVWQTVRLAPQTGAVCGNGSPYKFFVNRVPNTSNMLIYMEGGGACWDYASCSGQAGVRGARNPDGIPDDYMTLLNPGASLVSPLVFRDHPWSRVKTQNWNLVYVPYCTGDIYSGDRVAVYPNPDGGAPLIWHHNGLRNVRAVLSWIRDNLQRPAQLLSSGCSAGGVGSLVNYAHLRGDMAPTRAYLLNDSGPVFDAPVSGDPAVYPSLPLHSQIRTAWGLDDGPLAFLDSRLNGLDLGNLGTINRAVSSTFGNDRLGHTHFWLDLNYSAYSYERFHPDIANAPDTATRNALLHARWAQDTERLRSELASLYNYGYYLPQFRAVNESHCTTIIEFANADIQEAGLELDHFIRNLMEGSGAVMEASESSPDADLNKPFNPLYFLLDQLL